MRVEKVRILGEAEGEGKGGEGRGGKGEGKGKERRRREEGERGEEMISEKKILLLPNLKEKKSTKGSPSDQLSSR